MNNVSDYRRGQAWTAGAKAQRNGKTKDACNREKGTIYFDDWHDGFEYAKNEKQR